VYMYFGYSVAIWFWPYFILTFLPNFIDFCFVRQSSPARCKPSTSTSQLLTDWSWYPTTLTVGCVAQLAERRSMAGELTLSCARPAADGWPLCW